MIRQAKQTSYYVIRFNFIKFSTVSHNARCKFPIHQKVNENEPTVTPTANYVTCCRRRVASPVGGSSSALHPAGDSVFVNASDGVAATMRFQSVLRFENGVPECQRLAHVLSKK
jgi:hypothetical protein